MKLLVVDDNESDLNLIAYALRGLTAQIATARSKHELLGTLHDGPFDAAIVDYWLPNLPWPSSLELIREHSPECAIIIISGADSDSPRAYEAIRQGADDFVDKSRLNMLPHVIRRELIRRLAKVEREASLGKIAGNGRDLADAHPVVGLDGAPRRDGRDGRDGKDGKDGAPGRDAVPAKDP